MLITQASLANWQSSIHCLLCECVLSKSRACLSSLIPWCGTRWRESPMTLFYSPRLTLLSFFYANRQSRGTLIHCSVALQDGKLTRSHPDSLHHHVNVHREFSLWNKRVLFKPTTRLTSLALVFTIPSLNVDTQTSLFMLQWKAKLSRK